MGNGDLGATSANVQVNIFLGWKPERGFVINLTQIMKVNVVMEHQQMFKFVLWLLQIMVFLLFLLAILCQAVGSFKKTNFFILYFINPSQDSSIGSILAWYQGGPGSNPSKGENFSVKISNWFIWIWILIYSRFLRGFTARGYLLGDPPGYKANKL